VGLMFPDRCILRSRNIYSLTQRRYSLQADEFFSQLGKIYDEHIKPKADVRREGRKRIRIALLDTGVDNDDSFLKGLILTITTQRKKLYREEVAEQRNNTESIGYSSEPEFSPIRMVKSFIVPKDKGIDTCGHGTQTASLLLKVAPDADIYVAKVACNIKFNDTSAVVKVSHGASGCPQDSFLLLKAMPLSLTTLLDFRPLNGLSTKKSTSSACHSGFQATTIR
jgi:hypothetical protein